MDEIITGFVGLDAHAESTAIGIAEAGRAAARFVGTVGAKPAELIRAPGQARQAGLAADRLRGGSVRIRPGAGAGGGGPSMRSDRALEDPAQGR